MSTHLGLQDFHDLLPYIIKSLVRIRSKCKFILHKKQKTVNYKLFQCTYWHKNETLLTQNYRNIYIYIYIQVKQVPIRLPKEIHVHVVNV